MARSHGRQENDRKRIAFVTMQVSLGSIVYSNNKFAERLIRLGHEVDYVGVETVDWPDTAHLLTGVNCFSLDTTRVRQGPSAFGRYLLERRPDVVFASSHLIGLISALGIRSVPRKPKLITKAHVPASTWSRQQKTFFDRNLLPFALRLAAPTSAQFAAVSDAGASDLERSMHLPRGSVHTLYDPVLPKVASHFPPFQHPWLDDRSRQLILAVGRLAPEKDYSLLLKSFAKLRGTDRRLRLLILGEGGERSALEALGAELGLGPDDLSLPGAADPTAAYRRADLFVVTSRYEGLCNVIVEALDAGVPVVSTDCPVGPREVLEGGRLGRLVAVGDHEALASAMAQSLSGPHDPEPGRRRAQDFHLDVIWPKFAELAGIDPFAPAQGRGAGPASSTS